MLIGRRKKGCRPPLCGQSRWKNWPGTARVAAGGTDSTILKYSALTASFDSTTASISAGAGAEGIESRATGALIGTLLSSAQDQLWQEGRELGYIGNDDQCQKIDDHEGPDAGDDGRDRLVQGRGRDEDVEPEGWRDHADADVEADDQAEMDRINAEAERDREQCRYQHQQRRVRIDEHAGDQ